MAVKYSYGPRTEKTYRGQRLKMQMPEARKTVAQKTKICAECGLEFIGHPIAKYCELHRDPTTRKRRKIKYSGIYDGSREYRHTVPEDQYAEFTCALDGCTNTFPVLLLQSQRVYPKYCPEHRNEYRRFHFLRMRRLG